MHVGQNSVDIIAFHTAKAEHGSPREVPTDSAAENAESIINSIGRCDEKSTENDFHSKSIEKQHFQYEIVEDIIRKIKLPKLRNPD